MAVAAGPTFNPISRISEASPSQGEKKTLWGRVTRDVGEHGRVIAGGSGIVVTFAQSRGEGLAELPLLSAHLKKLRVN